MIKILETGVSSAATDGQTIDAQALENDLRAAVRGEVKFSDGYRAMYSTDASNYRQVPICVVLPRDKEDMIRAVAVCYKHKAPIVHRGGGTSLAGETCNAAVVIDSSKYMNRILEIDLDRRLARVQPGLVLDDLRDAVHKYGLTFGCAPSTHNRCTLGGMIGNNSCGMPAQMAGKTEENVEELELLTYDGLQMRVGATSDAELESIILEGGRRGEIYAKMRDLRDTYAGLIRERFPDIPRRVSGFCLNELLPENAFNVARALVGTEGTCVTVLEATVRLVPDPPHKALALLAFDDIATTGDHVPFCNKYAPTALEGMDVTLFQHMHEKGKSPHGMAELFPKGNAWLIVQFGGYTREDAHEQARRLADDIRGEKNQVRSAKVTSDPHEMQEIFALREAGLGVNAKIPHQPEFYPGWEDSAVAPEHLGAYLREFQQKMQEYGYYASIYGHFGQGCVHCRINFDLFTKEGIEKYRRFVHEMAHICVKYEGSVSGEHGDGQARGELLPIMYGDELVEAFWQFKTAFDPMNMMNPGKVVKPYRIDENLRWGVDYEPPDPKTKLHFKEDHGSFAYAANRCVGAGVCRKHDKGTMCPSYMASREEKYSTRGRARLLFEMLQGNTIKGGWRNDEVKESLEYCLACKACKHECPVNVDMATYKAEFLYQYFKGRLRPLNAWLFGYMFVWARFASLLPSVANFFTQAPPFSTIAKRIASIAPEREIPMFADRTFRAIVRSRPVRNAGGPRVILWVDTWNNYFHPQTALAAMDVLEDAGYQVIIPSRQICCGRPLYDYGLLDQAKRQVTAILDELRPLVREGVPIVGLEPSCLSVFKDEMHNMVGEDIDQTRFADQCFTFEKFLKEKAPHYKPPKLQRSALVHEHCHKKSLLDPASEAHLFADMQLDFDRLNSGCCGMAGAFGFEKSHYEMSVACGERVLLPKVREAKPETIVVADGFSCREQIMQLTERHAVHPAEVLKMAIDDRSYQQDDAYPERRFLPDERERRRRIITRGYAMLAGIGALAAVAVFAALRSRRE
jgi:FAD/FMN-containing dehydrogenase/Fe-S oxidoreductase